MSKAARVLFRAVPPCLVLLMLTLFLAPLPAAATSYHTVTIEGLEDFADDEDVPGTGGSTWYFTWDAGNFYFGIDASEVGAVSTTRYVTLYLDTDPRSNPLSGAGSSTGVPYNGQTPDLPFRADYHFTWKTDGTSQDIRRWDGSAWVDAGESFGPLGDAQVGHVPLDGYMEARISRALLGNPAAVYVVGATIDTQGGSESTFAMTPSANTPGPDANFSHFFGFGLAQGVSPDASAHLDATVAGVTSTEPVSNALDVAQTSNVRATFDQSIDADTLNTRTLRVRGSYTAVYTGSYSFPAANTVQLDPTQQFKPGEQIYVQVSRGLSGINGVLGAHYGWQFRVAVTGPGQGSFTAHPTTPDFGMGYSTDVALGDLDGDGDLDAVVANMQGQAETVRLNDGQGNLDERPTISSFGEGSESSAVALGDLDSDGDLDALVANYVQPETVWLNDGQGNFSARPTTDSFGTGSYSTDVALGDLDGDGDLDALVANGQNEAETVWLNDGQGNFNARPTTDSFGAGSHSTDVALGDLDGDGDLDAVVANVQSQAETVWLNDGRGNFDERPTTDSFGEGSESSGVALGDLDGDGDLDALVINTGGQAETVWLNDGRGNFNARPTTDLFGEGSFSTGVALGDLDSDGDLDALVINTGGQAETVWLNDGQGNFNARPTIASFGEGSESAGVALGDLDGDGGLDALIANYSQDETVWLNQTRPTVESTEPEANALDVARDADVSATFDEAIEASSVSSRTLTVRGAYTAVYDGSYTPRAAYRVELDSAQQFKPGEQIYVQVSRGLRGTNGAPAVPYGWQFHAAVTGPGQGSFTAHPTTPAFGRGYGNGVALGDLDGDGDLDAVVANTYSQAETVWLNDGQGNFDEHPTTASFGEGSESSAVALGDMDGDGDLDAVVANYGEDADTVWLNDGQGNFNARPIIASFGAGSYSTDVALGDLDGDGDLDAVFANDFGQAETVWLNDGRGNFIPRLLNQEFGRGYSFDVALGDLDGDGDLDAVVANTFDDAETVWLNDGQGNFNARPTTASFGRDNSSGVALGDLDGDGDLDAVVANYEEEAETVWLNDGQGNFNARPTTASFGEGSESYGLALGDLDGDGDLDALVINTGGQAETAWLNDGQGNFATRPTIASFGKGNSFRGALGDLDGDGDLDAVVTNYTGEDSGAQTVWLNKAGTRTLIISDEPDPSVDGQEVTVRYSVTSTVGSPTGSVTVSAGAGQECTGSVADGQCRLTLSGAGTVTLTATYAGDANFVPSADTEAHVVLGATATATSTSAGTPTATRTPTTTPASTTTVTRTPVSTTTVTRTPASTRTATGTRVSTQTATRTPGSTRTATGTRVSTQTATSTRVSTQTATSTRVSTQTATSTPASTRTPSRTPASTRTPSRTPASTRTPSRTPASTRTPSRTPVSGESGSFLPFVIRSRPGAVRTPTPTATARPSTTPTATNSRPPDLIVEQLRVARDGIEVVIANQGGRVLDEFWVDVYLDPDPPPTAVNQTWPFLSDEGLVWGVTAAALPLDPGERLTLRVGDAFYMPDQSDFSGRVAPGTAVYAQVDSAADGSAYGAVLEGHEIAGGPYNNILGPVFPAGNGLAPAGGRPRSSATAFGLPPRPKAPSN